MRKRGINSMKKMIIVGMAIAAGAAAIFGFRNAKKSGGR